MFQCKYCGHFSTITQPNFHQDVHFIGTHNSEWGKLAMEITAISCPNPECKKLQLNQEIFSYFEKGKRPDEPWQFSKKQLIESWHLLPKSSAKPIPDYIPAEIRSNYQEACLILNDSPKASAAMSRRCLQGIVRDFWKVPNSKRGNLGAEINYIKDKVDADTYESIQAVREVGDIGAHMEKSVDTIVNVEPEEAALLVDLIETLISDWYIERHRKEQRNRALRRTVEEKRAAKKVSKDAFKQIEDKSDTD